MISSTTTCINIVTHATLQTLWGHQGNSTIKTNTCQHLFCKKTHLNVLTTRLYYGIIVQMNVRRDPLTQFRHLRCLELRFPLFPDYEHSNKVSSKCQQVFCSWHGHESVLLLRQRDFAREPLSNVELHRCLGVRFPLFPRWIHSTLVRCVCQLVLESILECMRGCWWH